MSKVEAVTYAITGEMEVGLTVRVRDDDGHLVTGTVYEKCDASPPYSPIWHISVHTQNGFTSCARRAVNFMTDPDRLVCYSVEEMEVIL